jgi:hypothetical protein
MGRDYGDDMVETAEIAHARNARGVGVDAREALVKVTEELTTNNPAFVFATMDSDHPQWLFRVPNPEMAKTETWLNDDSAHLVHICQPAKCWEAMAKQNRPTASRYTGYVNMNLDAPACYECNKEVPAGIVRKAKGQIKMHEIRKKVS